MADPYVDELVSPADMIFMAMAGHPILQQRVATPREPIHASLSGRVFLDSDGDGLEAEGDQGVPGVEILLTGRTVRGEPVKGVLRTGADGRYTFEGLPPGSYSVARSTQIGSCHAGTVNGVPVGDPGDAGIERIGLPPGALAEGYLFAEVRTSGVSGLVMLEEEEDGIAMEIELVGIQVILSGVDGRGRVVQQSTRTDSRGAYRFTGLYPGRYDLFAAPRKGYAARSVRPGDRGGRADGPGKVAGVDLKSGLIGSRYNFMLVAVGVIMGMAPEGTVLLTGTDEAGNRVVREVRGGGLYRFERLRPGSYRVEAMGRSREIRLGPGAVACGQDLVGETM